MWVQRVRSFKSTAAGVGEANSAIGLVHHSVRPLYLSTAGGNFNNREILLCRIVTFGRIIYNVAYSYDTKCFCNFCGARSDLSFVIFPKANTPNANSFVIFDRKTHMNWICNWMCVCFVQGFVRCSLSFLCLHPIVNYSVPISNWRFKWIQQNARSSCSKLANSQCQVMVGCANHSHRWSAKTRKSSLQEVKVASAQQ